MMKKNKLQYYVYIKNINKGKIEKYNVLNEQIVSEIESSTLNISDKLLFSETIRQIIKHYYWSRSEWEITLTSWPTSILVSEFDRLNAELVEYYKKFKRKPRSCTINLAEELKVDIYDQVTLNWDIFINYLWEFLKQSNKESV